MSHSRKRELWCWVQGDDDEALFSIIIKGTDTVDHLKTLIKEKKGPEFCDMVAHKLKLWKVSRLDERMRAS